MHDWQKLYDLDTWSVERKIYKTEIIAAVHLVSLVIDVTPTRCLETYLICLYGRGHCHCSLFIIRRLITSGRV